MAGRDQLIGRCCHGDRMLLPLAVTSRSDEDFLHTISQPRVNELYVLFGSCSNSLPLLVLVLVLVPVLVLVLYQLLLIYLISIIVCYQRGWAREWEAACTDLLALSALCRRRSN